MFSTPLGGEGEKGGRSLQWREALRAEPCGGHTSKVNRGVEYIYEKLVGFVCFGMRASKKRKAEVRKTVGGEEEECGSYHGTEPGDSGDSQQAGFLRG